MAPAYKEETKAPEKEVVTYGQEGLHPVPPELHAALPEDGLHVHSAAEKRAPPPSDDDVPAPPPVYEHTAPDAEAGAPPPRAATLCGLRRPIFYAITVAAVVVVLALALGLGLGLGLRRGSSSSTSGYQPPFQGAGPTNGTTTRMALYADGDGTCAGSAPTVKETYQAGGECITGIDSSSVRVVFLPNNMVTITVYSDSYCSYNATAIDLSGGCQGSVASAPWKSYSIDPLTAPGR